MNLLQAPAQGGGMGTMIFMGLILLVFYVFMILPQMRKQKKQKTFRDGIGKGDKVITIGGIHGKITLVPDDNTFVIESEGTKIRIDRSAISMEATQGLNKDKLKEKEKEKETSAEVK